MIGSRWAGMLAPIAVVMALASPGPVFAASAPAVAQPAMADVILTGEIVLPAYLSADVEGLAAVEWVFDLTGVADIATVRFRPPWGTCTTATTSATCHFDVLVKQHGVFPVPELLTITPVEGAAPGSHGTIVMTASAFNAATGTHAVDVTIGNGVDLGIDGSRYPNFTARAGDTAELPLRVAVGQQAVNGAAVVFENPSLLRKADDFSNCRYVSTGPLACTFDTVLQPNTVYRLATPLKLRADPQFHEPFGELVLGKATWVTAAEQTRLADLRRQLGQAAGQPGHGGKLTLVPIQPIGSANGGAVPQGDAQTENNWQQFTVTVFARDASNFSVTVVNVPGNSPYLRPHLRVGIKNHGPSTVNVPGGNANGVLIKGYALEFFNVPAGCVVEHDQIPEPGNPNPGVAGFTWCGTGPMLRAGETKWIDLEYQVMVPSTSGRFTINEQRPLEKSIDPNPDDDEVQLLFPVTGPAAGGGGLPVTGDRTTLTGIAALLFLLTGAVLRYLSRRHYV